MPCKHENTLSLLEDESLNIFAYQLDKIQRLTVFMLGKGIGRHILKVVTTLENN